MESTLKYYQENAEALAERYEGAEVSELQKHLAKTFDLSDKILEIGCGSGRDAAFMHQQGFDVTAVDGASTMIENAVLLHPELVGRIREVILPNGLKSFAEQSFDGIYSIATLMHLDLEEIKVSLGYISKLLTRGGKFYFSVSIARDDVNSDSFDLKGRRFTTLSEKEWEDLCQSAGLSKLSSTYSSDGLGREAIIWLTCIMKKV
jgi:cyclopropane fatty-acyl-phospholipid synthase-like methyltransferase